MNQKTGTVRISKEVIRELKAFLAPTDGKIGEFVEGAIKAQLEANKVLKRTIGKK